MGIIVLFAFPAAIVFAVGNFFMEKTKVVMCTVASYVCCAVPVLLSFSDINQRAASGDFSGIMDIYPTMTTAIFLLFAVVTGMNVLAYLVRRRK